MAFKYTLRVNVIYAYLFGWQEFQGNGDRSTVVVNVFDPIIENARYIRIVPQEWHNHIALRMELFACKGGT